MSRLSGLKAAESLADVAALLRFKPKALSYLLYVLPSTGKYRTFEIPKRSGGKRTIRAPAEKLKVLQRNLAELLQDCVDELALEKKRRDDASHGFTRNRSIISNAARHRRRRWVFNIDLADFFPSINFGRVRGYFIRSRDFELSPRVATILAQVACFEGSLPQGSPCSPVIANLIAHILDIRLIQLAQEVGCTYTRYADDLTFSTSKKAFPSKIAFREMLDASDSHSWLPGEEVTGIIERSGFKINEKKTHMMYRSSRQNVTGLVVNKKVNVRWGYRHDVRSMVNRLVTRGAYELPAEVVRDGITTISKRPGTLDELHGMLGFIDSIALHNQGLRRKGGRDETAALSSAEKTYQRFLFYRTFYALAQPMVICEGTTDNIYITHAIRSLAAEFPELAEVLPDGKIRLRLRLYKYARSSTARLIELTANGSGSSWLARFVGRYQYHLRDFGGVGLAFPVVVLFDNDDGAKPICGAVRDITRRADIRDAAFVHVARNLYVMPTPGRDSTIEDFFDEEVKETVLDGKSFNYGLDYDARRNYGKARFAHGVVRPNADTIDFSGFRGLLANLSAAIEDYRAKCTPLPL